MPEPIQGHFAFSLHSDLIGGRNFHCQLATDTGPAGISAKVTAAEITQAVLEGITPVEVSECVLRVSNDVDESLVIEMSGRTVPKKAGEASEPFQSSATLKHFKSHFGFEELKGVGEFTEGKERYAPRDALLKREKRAGQ